MSRPDGDAVLPDWDDDGRMVDLSSCPLSAKGARVLGVDWRWLTVTYIAKVVQVSTSARRVCTHVVLFHSSLMRNYLPWRFRASDASCIIYAAIDGEHMMSVHDKDAEAREQPFFSSSYPGGELFIVAKGDALVGAGAHLPTICGPRQTARILHGTPFLVLPLAMRCS